jgi:hypothetical protein
MRLHPDEQCWYATNSRQHTLSQLFFPQYLRPSVRRLLIWCRSNFLGFSNSLTMTRKASSSFAYVQASGQPFSQHFLHKIHEQQVTLISQLMMACYPISISWTIDVTRLIVSSAFQPSYLGTTIPAALAQMYRTFASP